MAGLRLTSLNIESDKHFDRLKPFFAKEKPDIACLQEVFKDDLEILSELVFPGGEPEVIFLPQLDVRSENIYNMPLRGQWGIAILTTLPITSAHFGYYMYSKYASEGELPDVVNGDPTCPHRGYIHVDVTKDEKTFSIATVHFTWSKNGDPTDEQAEALENLLALLQAFPQLILTGDFNAPRGRKTFETLATHYKDNIPPGVTTTLDHNLHYAGKLDLVVDGLFTTEHYQAEDVRVVDGVSDHCAIVAEINHTEV